MLQKILLVLRENVTTIVPSQDGLYSMAFIINCIKELTDPACAVTEKQECLDLIWQEMHVIMGKLTNTKHKLTVLRTCSTQRDAEELNSDKLPDEDNMSHLDTQTKSEELSSSTKSLSEQSSSLNQDKQVLTSSENSKVNVSYVTTRSIKHHERRVYQSLSKHLVLEAYFEINRFMIMQMSGLDQQASSNSYEVVESMKTNFEAHTSIDEAVREVQRVIKSIVNGPVDKHVDDSDVDESEQLV